MSDIAAELAKLHVLKGADYSRQVERIARMGDFHPVQNEPGIYSAGSESEDDYSNLLNAARKAVSHGYKVYILPNPSGTRTPDFIFERKGTFRPYDLKPFQERPLFQIGLKNPSIKAIVYCSTSPLNTARAHWRVA